MTPWQNNVTLIQDGQPVVGSTPNKPITELYSRTQYLKERFDAALVGQALVARDKAVHVSTVVGTPVFFNETHNRFDPARAEVNYDDDSNPYGLAESAMVVGMVLHKHTSVLADVVLMGFVDELDLSAVLGSDYASGNYFLSALNAGGLVRTRPDVGLLVCQVMGDSVLVCPTIKDVLEDHVHVKFDLNWKPSGWLPADDSIFGGKAPACAVYGYDVSSDTILANNFPVSPFTSGYVELNGVGVTPSKCIVDENGIWWLTDDENELPWPAGYIESSSSSSSSTGCDYPKYSLVFWTTKMVFQNDRTVVTSLSPADGTVEFVNSDGEDATTGRLFARVVSTLVNGGAASGDYAGTAVKAISGNEYFTGPVVSGVRGAGRVTASGGTLIDGYRSGAVTLSLGGVDALVKGPVELIALDGVRKEIFYELPVLEFLSGRNSYITCNVWLGDFGIESANFSVGMWILGKVTGTLPTLQYSTRVISSPTGTGTAFPLVGSSLSNIVPGAILAQNYRYVETPVIAVDNEDMVMFSLYRNALTSDGYNGNFSVINLFYILRESV